MWPSRKGKPGLSSNFHVSARILGLNLSPMKSSRTRFLLAFFAAELLLAFLFLPRIHLRNKRTWMAQTDQLLRDKAIILARSINPADPSQRMEKERDLQPEVHHLNWQIFDRQGRLLRQGTTRSESLP